MALGISIGCYGYIHRKTPSFLDNGKVTTGEHCTELFLPGECPCQQNKFVSVLMHLPMDDSICLLKLNIPHRFVIEVQFLVVIS